MNQPKVSAIVVAAGRGERAGGRVPKQYAKLTSESVLAVCLRPFLTHPRITDVRVVIQPSHRDMYDEAVSGLSLCAPVVGGDTRQESVRNALEALSFAPPDFVLVHDAARPFVDASIIDRVLNALADHKGAIPGVPLEDTLKRVDGSSIGQTVPRAGLWRAQTPQGFHFATLLEAHRKSRSAEVTDDSALLERDGLRVAIVRGSQRNFKITTGEDLEMAQALVATATPDIRTGSGFDVHRFGDGDHVWLCGVRIPFSRRLEGHSDADVGLHALTDAILGALCDGDIGMHFPPSDPQWRGASSNQFVQFAAMLARKRKAAILNVDLTLICETPKVGPHRSAMRQRIAELLEIDLARVSVKATTTEQLGFTGRGEGIAAQALVTLRFDI